MLALLEDRTIESLVDLPLMTDPERLAVMDVLLALAEHLPFISPALLDLVVLREINLSIEHGNCDASTQAYAQSTMVLGMSFKIPRAGYRFCRMAHELFERGRLVRCKARVNILMGYYVMPWDDDMRGGRVYLERGRTAALRARRLHLHRLQLATPGLV